MKIKSLNFFFTLNSYTITNYKKYNELLNQITGPKWSPQPYKPNYRTHFLNLEKLEIVVQKKKN